jgi:glucokinase
MNRSNGSKTTTGSPLTGPLRPAGMRHFNARELFRLLRANSPCSRADLVRLSGLSAPTVSATVEHLEKRGLITTLGLGASAGGRPPGLLSLNPECAYVAGLEITSSDVRVALVNLEGSRVGNWTSRLPSKSTPAKIVEALNHGVDKLLTHHSIPRKKLYAVCAAAPGITDLRAGIVVSAPHLEKWEDIPLKQLLEETFRVPAIIENDVNLSALGERMEGAARGQDDFVFLWVDKGVGAGIFVDGKLHRGAIGSAGEIGYMRVPGTPAATLSIHHTGSLEDALGQKGLEEAWRQMHPVNGKGKEKTVTAQEILSLASAGHPEAVQIRDTIAAILSDVIINISVLLDPSMIVLGGEIGRSPALFGTVLKRVQQNDIARFMLVASHLGKDAALTGAVKLALETAESGLLNFNVE